MDRFKDIIASIVKILPEQGRISDHTSGVVRTLKPQLPCTEAPIVDCSTSTELKMKGINFLRDHASHHHIKNCSKMNVSNLVTAIIQHYKTIHPEKEIVEEQVIGEAADKSRATGAKDSDLKCWKCWKMPSSEKINSLKELRSNCQSDWGLWKNPGTFQVWSLVTIFFPFENKCFQQSHNQGLFQLFLTVSWDLHA